MSIEYDQDKSDWTLENRGFSFAYAARIFEGPFVERPSPRGGESRFLAVGRVDDTFIAVVYVWRAENRRIISARPARRKERDVYRSEVS